MFIWQDPKPCTNCGMMQEGHTRKNCPHIECYRFHEHGHMDYDCPNSECSYCRRIGHCKSKCPKLERKSRAGQGHRTNESHPTLESTQTGVTRISPSLSADLGSSMSPSRRVEASQNAVDTQSTRPSQTTQVTTTVSSEVSHKRPVY
ncbi:hypothetical protein N7519_011155 [Penicillium mononematosum]|uniref:uncharacterized protein n=1 Tax=Penicillium mononematosum TaxID=268346 RepID=UPI002547FD1E|nr:uncharacterized protein N7519_011155 [Penicillium mononematosum]KAJ6180694.1 hypothetical protein N7519_011155 [Penicillium mononematosum]